MQDAALLFTYCAAPRFTSITRLVVASALAGRGAYRAAVRHNQGVREAARRIFQLPVLSNHQIRRLNTPIKYRGMGLTSAVQHSETAYVESAAITAGDVYERFRSEPWMPQTEATFLRLPWLVAASHLRTFLMDEYPSLQLPPFHELTHAPQPQLQQKASRHISKSKADQQLRALDSSPRHKALIHSCRGVGASGWMTAIPYCDKTYLPNQVYRDAVMTRLGVDLPQALRIPKCICKEPLDPKEDHFFTCRNGGGENYEARWYQRCV